MTSTVMDLASGSLGGIAGTIVGHPFDTLKGQSNPYPLLSKLQSLFKFACSVKVVKQTQPRPVYFVRLWRKKGCVGFIEAFYRLCIAWQQWMHICSRLKALSQEHLVKGVKYTRWNNHYMVKWGYKIVNMYLIPKYNSKNTAQQDVLFPVLWLVQHRNVSNSFRPLLDHFPFIFVYII